MHSVEIEAWKDLRCWLKKLELPTLRMQIQRELHQPQSSSDEIIWMKCEFHFYPSFSNYILRGSHRWRFVEGRCSLTPGGRLNSQESRKSTHGRGAPPRLNRQWSKERKATADVQASDARVQLTDEKLRKREILKTQTSLVGRPHTTWSALYNCRLVLTVDKRQIRVNSERACSPKIAWHY